MTEYPEFRMGSEEAFCNLLRIHICQTEAAKGTLGGRYDRLLGADVLGYKILQHAISTLALYRGVRIPELEPHPDYKDAFSILGLARMCHEAFLLFNHLFVTPDSEDEAEFRFHAWSYVDTVRQSRFPTLTNKGQEMKDSIEKLADEIRLELERNLYFVSMTQKQQNLILQKLRWPSKSWSDLGQEAGFNELHATHTYRYLCSYAHPGSLSVRQLRLAHDSNVRRQLMETGLKHCAIIIACLISDYDCPFPKASILEAGSLDVRLVQLFEHYARGSY